MAKKNKASTKGTKKGKKLGAKKPLAKAQTLVTRMYTRPVLT